MRITRKTAKSAAQSMPNFQNDSDSPSKLGEFPNTSARCAARSVELHDIPIQEGIQTATRRTPPQHQSVQNTFYPVLKYFSQPHLRKDETNKESLSTDESKMPTSQGHPEVTTSSATSAQQNPKSNSSLASPCEPEILLLDQANENPHIQNEPKTLVQLFQNREEQFEEQRTSDEDRVLKTSPAGAQKRVEAFEALKELEHAREERMMARACFSSLVNIHNKDIEKMEEPEATRIVEYSLKENIKKEMLLQDSLMPQLAATKDVTQSASKDMAALKARNKSLEITHILDMLRIVTLQEEVNKQRLIIEGMCAVVSNTDTESHGRSEGSTASLKRSSEADNIEAASQIAKKRYTGYRALSAKYEVEFGVTATTFQDEPVLRHEKIEEVRSTTLQLLDSEVRRFLCKDPEVGTPANCSKAALLVLLDFIFAEPIG